MIRTVRASDGPAVRTVLAVAFDSMAEADMVERLRSDGDVLVELVATEWEVVVGSVMFSKATVTGDHGISSLAALAPLAVSPAHRRRGVGARLVRYGLAQLVGVTGVVVLGDPAYYGRFGFEGRLCADYSSPWAGPYLQAIDLGRPLPSGTLPTAGTLTYAPAVAALG